MPSHARSADALTISVRPAFAFEPATALVVATVERHPENRELIIQADSSSYYRSSLRQLDGEFEARTHRMWLSNLPAGAYTISVRLNGVGGELRAFRVAKLDVKGGSDERVIW